jgi:hypothetical protein
VYGSYLIAEGCIDRSQAASTSKWGATWIPARLRAIAQR